MHIAYKALFFILALISLTVAVSPAIAAPPTPTATFTLLTPLPTTLRVGESYIVRIQIDSNVPFNRAGVLAEMESQNYVTSRDKPAQHVSSAILEITLTGRRSTANLSGGVISGAILPGALYPGGHKLFQQFPIQIAVVE